MNQNKNSIHGGCTDIDISFLRFRTINIRKGEQKRITENCLSFIKGHFVFLEIFFCFDFGGGPNQLDSQTGQLSYKPGYNIR